MLQCNLYINTVLCSLAVDDLIIESLLATVKILDELLDSALIVEYMIVMAVLTHIL